MALVTFEITKMGSVYRKTEPPFARHKVEIALNGNNVGEARSIIELDISLPYNGIESVDTLEGRILDEVRQLLAQASESLKDRKLVDLYRVTDANQY